MSSNDFSTDPNGDPRFDGLMPTPRPNAIPEPVREERLAEVDQVAVRKLGGFNFIEPAQWNGLARDDRMQLIKSGAVTFLSQGEEVPLREALVALQAMSERETAAKNPMRDPAPGPATRPDQVNFDVGTPRPEQA